MRRLPRDYDLFSVTKLEGEGKVTKSAAKAGAGAGKKK